MRDMNWTASIGVTVGTLALLATVGDRLEAQATRRAPATVTRPGVAAGAATIQLALPASMIGGDSAAGSLTLSSNAPAGGLRVALSSDQPEIAVPTVSVIVPAFQRTASFTVTAPRRSGEAARTVTITAAAGGTSAARGSRAISVTQPAVSPAVAAARAGVRVQAPSGAGANAALSEPGRTAIVSRLEPAPPVTGWHPRRQAATGTSIVITGSGFRPGDLAVRIGDRKLAIVEATPTRVVARAPSASDPGVSDPFISGPLTVGHASGQLRTLDSAYRVVERWDGYQPRAASVQLGAMNPTYRVRSTDPVQWFVPLEIIAEGLPGDEVLWASWAPATDGTCAKQRGGGSVGVPVEAGRATIRLSTLVDTWAQHCRRLTLELQLRYRDVPADTQTVALDLGPAQLRTVVRVENTQELVDAGVLTFEGGNGSGTCAGEVEGTAVGPVVVAGDAAFRVRQELGIVQCAWNLAQSKQRKWILRNDGWVILALGWSEPTSSQGQHCGVATSLSASPGMFVLDRGHVYMGRGERRLAPDSTMNVVLGCIAAAQAPFVSGLDPNAPRTVTARLEWVALLAPTGAQRWQDLRE